MTVIHVEGLDKMEKTPAAIMEELLEQHQVGKWVKIGRHDQLLIYYEELKRVMQTLCQRCLRESRCSYSPT